MKIIFFIGTLATGGKERRLVELLKYLKENTNYEILLVLRQGKINYEAFYEIGINYKILTKSYIKKDPRLPFYFLSICRRYKPNLIHTWGSMPTFVAILSSLILHIPLINSQITSAPPKESISLGQRMLNKINFAFSDKIISNSYAGIESFNPPRRKSIVIYNGIDLQRFEDLTDKDLIKEKYGIITPFVVIMVASFTKNKDYNRFIRIANIICQDRKDISFLCVGGPGKDISYFELAKKIAANNPLIIFTGIISEVEALVNACDIGVLFSPYGEGISNAILEYMALSKPVIAYDSGGTREVIKNGENGFLIKNEDDEQISKIIIELIDNYKLRKKLGENGRKKIEEYFNIQKMGKEYMNIYNKFI